MSRAIPRGSVWGDNRRYRNGPHEQSAQSVTLGEHETEVLNDASIRRMVDILEERQLVTRDGAVRLCGALEAIADSRMGKVQALADLGAAVRHVLTRLGAVPQQEAP